jgi:hypothetical protein
MLQSIEAQAWAFVGFSGRKWLVFGFDALQKPL